MSGEIPPKYQAMLALVNVLYQFKVRPAPAHVGTQGPMTVFKSRGYAMYVRITDNGYTMLRYSKGPSYG